MVERVLSRQTALRSSYKREVVIAVSQEHGQYRGLRLDSSVEAVIA